MIFYNKMIISKGDLTNAIEPSETGGKKIANAIWGNAYTSFY